MIPGNTQISLQNHLKTLEVVPLEGNQEGRKWALVKWEEVCKIKLNGGIGCLRDPKNLNKVLSSKIKWIWIKIPQHLWEQL